MSKEKFAFDKTNFILLAVAMAVVYWNTNKKHA